jgi:hypothetical protein
VARETNVVLRWAVLAASVSAIALLAGCGGDDGSDSPATETGSAEAGTEQTGAPPADVEDFGEEADPADHDAATRAVQEFLHARAEGDSAKECSLMAASAVEGQRCTEVVEAVRSRIQAKTLAQVDRIQVTGVRIEGDSGFVLYRNARGLELAFPVVREGSGWKVASIAGQSLP